MRTRELGVQDNRNASAPSTQRGTRADGPDPESSFVRTVGAMIHLERARSIERPRSGSVTVKGLRRLPGSWHDLIRPRP
jgi:hypothetical protein